MRLYVYGSWFGRWHRRPNCGRSVLEVVVEPDEVPVSLRCPACWAPVPKEQLPLEEGAMTEIRWCLQCSDVPVSSALVGRPRLYCDGCRDLRRRAAWRTPEARKRARARQLRAQERKRLAAQRTGQ